MQFKKECDVVEVQVPHTHAADIEELLGDEVEVRDHDEVHAGRWRRPTPPVFFDGILTLVVGGHGGSARLDLGGQDVVSAVGAVGKVPIELHAEEAPLNDLEIGKAPGELSRSQEGREGVGRFRRLVDLAGIEKDHLLHTGARLVFLIERLGILVSTPHENNFGWKVSEIGMRIIGVPYDGHRIPADSQVGE